MTKAERTRHFIVEKAAPIINRKGMAATSINDIVEATSLTKGSVYGNFESKEEICLEAFDYLAKRLAADMNQAIARGTTSREKLNNLFNYYLSYIADEKNYGCPILNFGTEADDTNPAVKVKVNKAILYGQNLFAKVVRTGMETGEFKKTIDADAFGIKAFAILEAGMWIARLQGSTKQMQILIDSLNKEISDYCQ